MALPSIQELPEDESRKLRSSVVVPSLSQLTEELVCNSLDAGATEVYVTVDSSAVTVRVDDNGCGISRDELVLLGERQATSKLQSITELEAGPTTLGFRGEALFSIIALSLVEISSRPKGSASTYCKICKGGRTLSVGMTRKQRATGTTVIVQDVFFNQPVRRQLAEKNLSKEIQSIKDRIGHLAFMHPGVSFRVADVVRSKSLLYLPGGRSVGSSISEVFGDAIFQSMKEVDYQKGSLRLSGFISRRVQEESSRDVQYLYINKRLVKHTRLHKLLNSSFTTALNLHSEVEAGTELTSFRDLMFVVNLSCPWSSYDVTFEPTKTYVEFKNWKTVFEFFQEVLSDLWSCSKKALAESGPLVQTRKRSQKPWQKVDPNYRPSHPVSLSKKSSKDKLIDGGLVFPDGLDDFLHNDSDAVVERDLSKTGYSLRSKARPTNITDSVSRCDDDIDQDSVCTPRSLPRDKDLDNASQSTPQLRCSKELLELDILAVADISSQELSPFASARDLLGPPLELSTGGNWSSCRKEHRMDLFQSKQFASSPDIQLHPDGFDNGTSRRLFGRAGHDDLLSGVFDPKRRKMSLLEEEEQEQVSSHLSKRLDTEHIEDGTKKRVQNSKMRTAYSVSTRLVSEAPAIHSFELNESAGALTEAQLEDNERVFDRSQTKQQHAKGLDRQKKWGLVACGGDAGSKHGNAAALPHDVEGAGGTVAREEVSPAPAHLDIAETHRADEKAGCCCSSKWRDGHAPACTDKDHNGSTKSVKELYQNWCRNSISVKEEAEPEILDLQTLTSRSMQTDSCRSHRGSLIPSSVSKETLLRAKCLKQVDGKFLIATSGSTLVAIDQHAADERICLEELRKEVLQNESAVMPLLLATPSDLPISAGQEGCLRSYRRQIERWGWRFKLSSAGQADKSTSTRHSAHAGADALAVLNHSRQRGPSECTPTRLIVLAVPHLLGTSLRAEDILDYLLQLQESGGLASTPPHAVLSLLASKACRGAIMFGDMLKPSECSQLIQCLKHTQLPFQCAHGRPTMVPLVDLQELNRLVRDISPQNPLRKNVDSSRSQGEHSQRTVVSLVQLKKRLANTPSL